jgi:hypothetical protein
MQQLAWKLETAHSVADVEKERRNNREARDEWAKQLNSNLSFMQRYFRSPAPNAPPARDRLEDIASGFGTIHEEFNSLFKRGTLDKDAISRIEADIDSLNPKVHVFDLDMTEIIAEQSAKCPTLP